MRFIAAAILIASTVVNAATVPSSEETNSNIAASDFFDDSEASRAIDASTNLYEPKIDVGISVDNREYKLSKSDTPNNKLHHVPSHTLKDPSGNIKSNPMKKLGSPLLTARRSRNRLTLSGRME